MNILIIANIYPYETGGAEMQVRHLIESFIKNGHSVTVAGNRIPTIKEQAKLSDNFFNCIHIPTITTNKITRAVSYITSLTWFILTQKNRFDIIYCRFLREPSLIVSVLKILHITSLPMVSCPSCAGAQGDIYFLKKLPLTKLIVTILNKGCDAVNIINPQIKKEIDSIKLDKIYFSFIPNGVNTKIKTIKQFNNRTSSINKSFIFIGRLTEQKGLSYLLEAWRKVIRNNMLPHLTIVGDGPDKTKLQQLTQDLKLEQHVTYLGLVSHSEINNLLCAHDIFVLPSVSEGHPNALLEAMAVGLPSIVTQCGGSEYFIDNTTGRVVPPRDSNSLATAVVEMSQLSTEALCLMSQAARASVKKKFDIDVVASRYIELFKQYV